MLKSKLLLKIFPYPMAADVIRSRALRELYLDPTSRLNTLSLDVVRYMIDPLCLTGSLKPLYNSRDRRARFHKLDKHTFPPSMPTRVYITSDGERVVIVRPQSAMAHVFDRGMTTLLLSFTLRVDDEYCTIGIGDTDIVDDHFLAVTYIMRSARVVVLFDVYTGFKVRTLPGCADQAEPVYDRSVVFLTDAPVLGAVSTRAGGPNFIIRDGVVYHTRCSIRIDRCDCPYFPCPVGTVCHQHRTKRLACGALEVFPSGIQGKESTDLPSLDGSGVYARRDCGDMVVIYGGRPYIAIINASLPRTAIDYEVSLPIGVPYSDCHIVGMTCTDGSKACGIQSVAIDNRGHVWCAANLTEPSACACIVRIYPGEAH